MKLCVFRYAHRRSKELATALEKGAAVMGWQVVSLDNETRVRESDADVFASYGWINKPLFDFYRDSGRQFIYLDLGYWSRKSHFGDYSGYHKAVVNARHATEYFQIHDQPGDRLDDAPTIQDWKTGGEHIVLAGMSEKTAPASGFRYLEWEHKTIRALREITDRPIMYRPKPSDKRARPIPDCLYSPGTQGILTALNGACCLVTLHSNAAIDAMAYGLPFHATEGLASRASVPQLDDLFRVNPAHTLDRERFLRQVSYCHWTRHEIADGTMFAQYIEDGILPHVSIS